jgi:hypothetical protein
MKTSLNTLGRSKPRIKRERESVCVCVCVCVCISLLLQRTKLLRLPEAFLEEKHNFILTKTSRYVSKQLVNTDHHQTQLYLLCNCAVAKQLRISAWEGHHQALYKSVTYIFLI